MSKGATKISLQCRTCTARYGTGHSRSCHYKAQDTVDLTLVVMSLQDTGHSRSYIGSHVIIRHRTQSILHWKSCHYKTQDTVDLTLVVMSLQDTGHSRSYTGIVMSLQDTGHSRSYTGSHVITRHTTLSILLW